MAEGIILTSDLGSNPFGYGFPFTVDPKIASSELSFTANRLYYMRVIGGGIISSLRFYVGAGSTLTNNLYVATYQNSGSGVNAVPAARTAVSASTVMSAASTVQTVNLTASVAVAPGDWFAIVSDTTTGRLLGLTAGLLGVSGLLAHQDLGSFIAPPASATPTMSGVRIFSLIGV